MSIERNIIFLYPISAKLKELKEELEKDENVMVYELDSVNEYGQLIGVMEHSITFSSDIKKTESYLNDCKQFVKSKTSKNFVIQDKMMPPHIFSKLQRSGLNEVIQESVPLKNYLHKVNMFFTPFEQALKKEEEEKNKAVTEQFVGGNTLLGNESKKESYSSTERQRVEKMASMDEEKGQLKTSKKKSGFDLNTMLGGQLSSNFVLKKNSTDMSMLKSPFDKMQRKKVATFDPVALKSGLKRGHFTPVSPEFNNNPHKDHGIKPPGELNKRKASGLNFTESEMKRRKVAFDEVTEQLSKKRTKFDEVEKELARKRAKFEEVRKELERKQLDKREELEKDPKKKKKFEEVLKDLNKKRTNLELEDAELKKKKNLFEEVNAELKRKKSLYEEAGADLEKKKGILLELEELQKKKKNLFNEIEAEQRKKKNFIEEELEKAKVKKLELGFENEVEKKKGVQEEELDYNKKKGQSLKDVEIGKKNLKFEEVEIENEKKDARFKEADKEKNKKTEKFKEVERDRENKTIDLKNPDYIRKNGDFDEVKKDSLFSAKDIVIGKKEIGEDELEHSNKKEFEENILDYSQFKKKKKDGSLSSSEEEAKKIERQLLDKILEEPEYTFYDNQSFGLEYLVIHSDFLLKENMTAENLFKFIHFALIKEYEGDISFYLFNPSSNENASVGAFQCLYCGHETRGNKVLQNDFQEFEKENLTSWEETRLPTWKDETYQVEVNEFIYPYFEDGELLGFSVAHFRSTVNDHLDAAKVELLSMCLKGSMLDEFMKNNEK